MLAKGQFLASVGHETKVCKHLYSKVTPDRLEFRLGEGMRSTLDLLRYLTHCGVVPARAILREGWDGVSAWLAEAGEMRASAFPEHMDAQATAIRDLLSDLSDEEMESRRVTLPWGLELALGEALVATSLKFLTAYRMQLFLNLKASGTPSLDTYNCWLGMDRPVSA